VLQASDIRGCTRCDHVLPEPSLEQQGVVWLPECAPVQPLPEAVVKTVEVTQEVDYFEAASLLYHSRDFFAQLPAKRQARLQQEAAQATEAAQSSSSWDPPSVSLYPDDTEGDHDQAQPIPTAQELLFIYQYWTRTMARVSPTVTQLLLRDRVLVRVMVVKRQAPVPDKTTLERIKALVY